MATTDYRILVDTSQAIASINQLSGKMAGVGEVASRMNTLLGAAISGASLAAYAQFSDSITNIRNRLVTVSIDAADTARQFSALAAIAIETRSSFEGVSAVYNKMMMVSKTLGLSQKDAAFYTEVLAKSLALTGATTAETNSVLLQFSQGLSAGRFQGDELRAILEGNTVIVQALAKEMGVGTQQIKQLGSEGKITADIMLKALGNSADEIAAKFAKMTPTISQAFEILKTSSMVAFNEFETHTKTGEKFAYAVEYIAMTIQKLGATVDEWIGPIMTFGKVLLSLLAFTAVGRVIEGLTAVAAAAGTAIGELVVSIRAIGSVISPVINVVEDFIIVLGKLFTGKFADMEWKTIFSGLSGGFDVLKNKVIEASPIIASSLAGAFKPLATVLAAGFSFAGMDKIAAWFNSFGESSSESRKKVEDFQAANHKSSIEALSDSKSKTDAVTQQSKQVTEQISRETAALNKLVAAYKESTQAAMSKFQVDTESIGMSEKDKLALQEQTAAFDAYKSKIDEIRADIAAKQATGSESDLAMIPKLEVALSSLTESYNKQQGAINGLVDARVRAEAVEQMSLFNIKERIDKENQLMKLQDEIAKSTMSEIERKYYDIDAAARDAARSQIQAEEARRHAALSDAEKSDIYAATSAGLDQIKLKAEEQYNVSRSFATGWASAFKTYRDNAYNYAQQAQKIFQSVTQGMEDMIVNFTKTGKLNWQSFLNSIVEMLLRSQIQQLMANVFGGIGGGANTSGGSLLGGIGSLLGFADGGIIPTNSPVLVGERGPEIISGAGGRSVTPNGQLGSHVTYNINAVDAMSFKQMLAKDPSFLYAVSEQGRRRLPGGR